MRFSFAVLVSMCLALGSVAAQAQFGDFLNKIKDRAQQEVNNAEDKAIDRTVDTAKGAATGKSTVSGSGGTQSAGSGAGTGNATVATYKNYDFVPGDKIIFQSDLANEQVGEIPSQFTVLRGQLDVQVEDGENVIRVPKGAGAAFAARMSKISYLPSRCTIEFDVKNERFGIAHLKVDFGPGSDYASEDGITHEVFFTSDDVTWTLGSINYPTGLASGFAPMQWHHIAIAINGDVGKVYVDQYRVVNANNLTGKPRSVTLNIDGYENSYVKNLRIAAGGIDVYRKITTLTKIVTHGILFDVDKATLKPESMGTINEIATLLKRNPSLKFEIDGHTDDTGNAAHNLALSKQRADAVAAQLGNMGIGASRLKTKGYGDTKPIASNDTPEGRANNRRVEFVKI